MFRGYWEEPERYRKCFAGGFYLTGDLARRDRDGYFWFVGRADDVIKTSGHLIGPFEVESVLHGAPGRGRGRRDRQAGPGGDGDGQGVRLAQGRLRADATSSAASCSASRARASGRSSRRRRSSSGRRLPKTRSGKIMRRLLKARELGLPEGDTSTLEDELTDRDAMTLSAGPPRRTRPRAASAPRDAPASAASRRRRPSSTRAGKIRGFLHLYIGEEAVAVGAMQALTADDAIVATYREHGHALARGIPAGPLMAEMYGKANGCSRGRGGSMHFFDVSAPLLRRPRHRRRRAARSRWAWRWPTSCRARARVTACFFGDGAVAEGEFHESLNLAALGSCRCSSSARTTSTRWARRSPATRPRPTSRAQGRGATACRAEAVDGMDVLAVEAATRRAADAVRRGRRSALPRSSAPTASARTRCPTPSSTARRRRSRSGRRAIRSRSSQRGFANGGLLTDADLAALEAAVAGEIDGRGRASPRRGPGSRSRI